MIGLMRPRGFDQDVDSRLDSATPADESSLPGSCARRGRAIIVGALVSLLFWGGLVYALVRLL